MSVLYIALPIALLLGGSALVACVYSIRDGQFDDLESPPLRILHDERKAASGDQSSVDSHDLS